MAGRLANFSSATASKVAKCQGLGKNDTAAAPEPCRVPPAAAASVW